VSEPGEAEPKVRYRRVRGLRETLLSIVLTMEAVVMFFATLVFFGLHVFPPAEAFTLGASCLVVLALLAGLQRWAWAVYLGAAAQVGLILLGLFTPAMYVVGGLFAAVWLYCFLRSRQIERQHRLAESESP
jgi:membrane-bound ClpP family serine protease